MYFSFVFKNNYLIVLVYVFMRAYIHQTMDNQDARATKKYGMFT